MTHFEFATAARIVFGPGSFAQLPGIAAGHGRRPLIVTGKRRVDTGGLEGTLFSVTGEPTISTVRAGVDACRSARCDSVVSIGGGSAIDAGKAVAAVAANSGDPLDYAEVIGRGLPLEHAPLPFIAVPTTAGTGSEVTRNAVLGSPEHGVKVSIRSPLMLARAAVIDPELTLGLPPAVTATTGLDALTQLIEPYVSSRANPLTDSFCTDGLRHVASSLLRAYRTGEDKEPRIAMAHASLLGGLSLANAGLGVIHGFAAPIGGMFDAPHGGICAALLAAGMLANIKALRERMPKSEALERYRYIACILTGDPGANAEDGASWVRDLVKQLSIHGLAAYGLELRYAPALVEKAQCASSMKANPVALTNAELTGVIENSL